MIYKQVGLSTSKLTTINSNTSDFNVLVGLANNCNKINSTTEKYIDQYKHTQLTYVIAGELTELKRSNTNYKSCSLIFADFDDINDENEFVQNIKSKLSQYSYILYPSINYGLKGVRYHLALDPSRSFQRNEKVAINDSIKQLLELPSDWHQNTWSQLFSVPVETPLNKDKVIINYGESFKVDAVLSNVTERGIKSLDVGALADSIHVSPDAPKTEYKAPQKQTLDLSSMPSFQAIKQVVAVANNDAQKALIERDVPLLKTMWKQAGITANIPANFQELTYVNKLKSLNLRAILGVSQQGSFNDVLGRNSDDRDASPSANIDAVTGLYRSFRFNVSLNPQQLLMKMCNFSNPVQLVEFLEEVTCLEFESEYQKRFRRFIKMYSQEYKELLSEDSTSPIHVDFVKLMKRHNLQSTMFALLSHANDYAPASSITGKSEDFVVFCSAPQLAQEVAFVTGKLPAEHLVKNHVNQLIKLGLVEKVPDNQLDPVVVRRFHTREHANSTSNHASAFRFSTDLPTDICAGVTRFQTSNHNSMLSNASYNLDEAMKSKIVAQPSGHPTNTCAERLRVIISALILKHNYMSSNELATCIHQLPEHSNSKNWMKKEKEKITKVDNRLIGIETSRATKDFKQAMLKQYGEVLDYAPASLIYYAVPDDDALEQWVTEQMQKYGVTDELINSIDR